MSPFWSQMSRNFVEDSFMGNYVDDLGNMYAEPLKKHSKRTDIEKVKRSWPEEPEDVGAVLEEKSFFGLNVTKRRTSLYS